MHPSVIEYIKLFNLERRLEQPGVYFEMSVIQSVDLIRCQNSASIPMPDDLLVVLFVALLVGLLIALSLALPIVLFVYW